MLGAIIGDIVGSRWEFDPTNDYDFEMFSDENSFTDDTVCTIAVADAIAKGRDYGESIHEWCRRYPFPMGGYGGRFHQWVMSDAPKPYNSFGNGSAMRSSRFSRCRCRHTWSYRRQYSRSPMGHSRRHSPEDDRISA